MALTPVEIRHIRLGRGSRGYKRHPVDTLLVEVAESFEDVWRRSAPIAPTRSSSSSSTVRHGHEALLRTTLVSAESAAQQLREQARKEAETIVGEAHAEARAIARRAASEKERARNGAAADRSLLRRRSTVSTRRPSTSASPWASRRARSGARSADPPARLSLGLWLRPRPDCGCEVAPGASFPASSGGTATPGSGAWPPRLSGARTTPFSTSSRTRWPCRARASHSSPADPPEQDRRVDRHHA